MASGDEDVRLLMMILGVGYYSALLVKSEIRSVDRFSDWFRPPQSQAGIGGMDP
jgi:hypothetical protein